MNISKIALSVAEKCRPVLVKMIPAGVLSVVKAKVIYRGAKKLEKTQIRSFEREYYPDGINLAGSIRCDTGLGQSMRLVADIIDNTGIPYMVYNYYVPPGGSMMNTSYDKKISDEFIYNINLIHVNPSEMAVAFMDMGVKRWDYRYNIGYWVWELEDFPKEWLPAFHLVDEVWTPSKFVTNVLKKYTSKPVYTIPFAVTAPVDKTFDRTYFHLPENQFLFLMMYNSGSTMERKNPMGVIEAFKMAFDKNNHDVGLVIKIGQSDENSKDMEYLKTVLDGYDNIYFIWEMLPKEGVNALIACADVFVSLHRAEGFGLVMAEAMQLGTPCIATNWSANTEFMDEQSACMVDYEMVRLDKDIFPFKKGYRWAKADIVQASQYMQRLFLDKSYYEEKKINAKRHIEDRLGMERSSGLVRRRINQILEEKQ